MEKKNDTNNNSSDDQSVCQKLFTAFKVSPAFQTIRRISYRPRDPTPTAVNDNRHHSFRAIEIKTKSVTDKPTDRVLAVPIRYVPTNTTTTNNNNSVAVERVVSEKNDVVSLHDKRKLVEEEPLNQRKIKKPETTASTDHDINARFTEYIKSAGTRIRSIQESDGWDHQKNSSGTDHGRIIKTGSFKDHFSDYIHRTRANITSPARSAPNKTSTSGKSVSFKTE